MSQSAPLRIQGHNALSALNEYYTSALTEAETIISQLRTANGMLGEQLAKQNAKVDEMTKEIAVLMAAPAQSAR